MTKNNKKSEKNKAYYERQRGNKPPKEAPKSARERMREYRARKKALLNAANASASTENSGIPTVASPQELLDPMEIPPKNQLPDRTDTILPCSDFATHGNGIQNMIDNDKASNVDGIKIEALCQPIKDVCPLNIVELQYSGDKAAPSSDSGLMKTDNMQEAFSTNELESAKKSDAKPKKVKKRSKKWLSVWQYFTEESATMARCNLCHRVYKYIQYPSNLRQHLIKMHNNVIGNYEFSVTKRKSQLNDYTTTPSESSTESENDLPPLKRRKIKLRSKKKSNRTDEVLERTNSFMECGKDAEEITNSILYMLVVDGMSLSAVDNKGLKNFMKTVAPLYALPSTETLARLLDARYAGSTNGSVLNLAKAESYTLTFDSWRDDKNQINLHIFVNYVTEDLIMDHIRIGVLPLPKYYTNENVTKIISSVFEDSSLVPSRVTAVLTGRAIKTKKAVQELFGKDKHFNCFLYTLSNLVTSVLRAVPGLRQTIDKVRSIVSQTVQSRAASEKLRQLQMIDEKTEETTLLFVQEASDHWTSTLAMLERFIILERYVDEVIAEFREQPIALTLEEIKILKDLVSLVKPVGSVVAELRENTYSTCSVIVPTVNCLRSVLGRYETLTSYGSELREKILSAISARFEDIESHRILAMAAILDPRFKRSSFVNELDATAAVSQIYDSSERKEVQRKTMIIKTESSDDERSCTYNLWDYNDRIVTRQAALNEGNGEIGLELTRYLNEPVIPPSEDPLRYWGSRKLDFPSLYKLAIKYVGIVGTLVSSERLFYRADDAQNKSTEL